jgi:hypothetical protein
MEEYHKIKYNTSKNYVHPSVRLHIESDPECQSVEEENILDAVQRNALASTRPLVQR